MKKISFICLMLIQISLAAMEWESSWIAAMEDFHEGDYLSAEQNFNTTVNLLENANDLEHHSVYVDRAHLYLLSNKYEEALLDANKAIFSENLSNKERVKAVSIRVAARANLGFLEGFETDIEFLAKNFEVQMENTPSHVIIRNMPKCQTFRKFIARFFVDAGICESQEDVQILASDICIANKTAHFEALDASKHLDRNSLQIQTCKDWCDANALAAIGWCVSFPEFCLIKACNLAVADIQNSCRACCQNGFYQEVCAAPFADIVLHMQKYLPPCGCK